MSRRLIDVVASCRTVYFFGLAKNTGKTTALRQTMGEARAAGRRILVTSVGRDGEAFDAIYSTLPKPRLPFSPGDFVVTTTQLLKGQHGCRPVRSLGFTSPLGDVVAAVVEQPCLIEVAGPSTRRGVLAVRAWAEEAGADLVLVDGALDRKGTATPDLCDGVIVSTGAAVAETAEQVVAATEAVLDMARAEAGPGVDAYPRIESSPVFDQAAALVAALPRAGHEKVLVDVAGALTEEFLDALVAADVLRRTVLRCESFASVLVRPKRWTIYRAQGLEVLFKSPTRVLALTVNPITPEGPRMPAESLIPIFRRSLGIPVFDVCGPEYGGARHPTGIPPAPSVIPPPLT